MLISRLITVFVLLSVQNFAQSKSNSCPCSLLLNESIQKVSAIYAGFNDKVTTATRPQYDQLVSRLKILAAKAKGERDCYEIIKEYTRWFKDKHIDVWFGIKSSAAALRKVNLKNMALNTRAARDSIEGTWSTADGKQRYKIIPDPSKTNEFIAITIASADSAWAPGMIKAEFYEHDIKNKFYRGMYYQKDFDGVLNGFTLNHNRLDHYFGPSWYRTNSINAKPVIPAENIEPVQFKVLNKDFVYLKLGRFMQYYVDKLDSLIRANYSIIYSTKNLVLDLRGNHGGDGSSSQEMIQLIYTKPIIYPSWQYRSSPESIQWKQEEVAELLKNDPYKRIASQQLLLQNLIDHPGQLVSSGDSIVRKMDSAAHYPERVALLTDGESASSSEFFTFESKQSKKVTVFGANTAGAMDYGEQQSLNLSCGQFIINIPWGRNGWVERFGFRVDNIGFKPDVPVSAAEKDWVQFIVKYWSKMR